MTALQYARMLISDPDQKIFTDDQIQEVILLNTRQELRQLKPLDLGNNWDAQARFISEPCNFYDEDLNEITDATYDAETGQIQTTNQYSTLYLKAGFIDWDHVHGELLMMIATDIQRWNTYSAGGLSETFDKATLLKQALLLMGVQGAEM